LKQLKNARGQRRKPWISDLSFCGERAQHA